MLGIIGTDGFTPSDHVNFPFSTIAVFSGVAALVNWVGDNRGGIEFVGFMSLNLAYCLFQKMEILPVTDLGMALHDFVNKDDKQAFYACVHQNLDVTQVIS